MLSNGHLNRITLGKREYIIWNCTERFPEAFGKEIPEADAERKSGKHDGTWLWSGRAEQMQKSGMR